MNLHLTTALRRLFRSDRPPKRWRVAAVAALLAGGTFAATACSFGPPTILIPQSAEADAAQEPAQPDSVVSSAAVIQPVGGPLRIQIPEASSAPPRTQQTGRSAPLTGQPLIRPASGGSTLVPHEMEIRPSEHNARPEFRSARTSQVWTAPTMQLRGDADSNRSITRQTPTDRHGSQAALASSRGRNILVMPEDLPPPANGQAVPVVEDTPPVVPRNTGSAVPNGIGSPGIGMQPPQGAHRYAGESHASAAFQQTPQQPHQNVPTHGIFNPWVAPGNPLPAQQMSSGLTPSMVLSGFRFQDGTGSPASGALSAADSPAGSGQVAPAATALMPGQPSGGPLSGSQPPAGLSGGVPTVPDNAGQPQLSSPASSLPSSNNGTIRSPVPPAPAGGLPSGVSGVPPAGPLPSPQPNAGQLPAAQPSSSQPTPDQFGQTFDPSAGPGPVPAVPGTPSRGTNQPLPNDAVTAPQVMPQPAFPPFGTSVPVPPSARSGYALSRPAPGTSGYRATEESDAAPWMAPYDARTSGIPSAGMSDAAGVSTPVMPADFRPWWTEAVVSPIGVGRLPLRVDVGLLVRDALNHSPQIAAARAEPEILYRVLGQEAARFDWRTFLETTYDDLNDPVGNTLTTAAGRDRLSTRRLRAAAGGRRDLESGGELEIAQRIRHEDQDSIFFVPNHQGAARLELNYRQPLLNGRGAAYNRSDIVLARIQANMAEDEAVQVLQDHLLQVTEAYWAMYHARAEYLQRKRLLDSAGSILEKLRGREQVDTVPRQVLRAESAVAQAATGIRRTVARVQDAQAQLRLLVNSPGMLNGNAPELLPLEHPQITNGGGALNESLRLALANRPDISQAIRTMRGASVRLNVSRNELLPKLDLLVNSYLADLSASSDIPRAFGDQFTDNRPSYTVGLEFEIPIGNRAARNREEQRRWELTRAVNTFRATVEKGLTDVEIAAREVATAEYEVNSRYHAMQAARDEAEYLRDRFELLPEAEASPVLLLEDLLDALQRLADSEALFTQAQANHAVAVVRLRREQGTLLRSRHAQPQIDSSQSAWLQARVDRDAAAGRSGASGFSDEAVTADADPNAWRLQSISAPTRISPSSADLSGISAAAADYGDARDIRHSADRSGFSGGAVSAPDVRPEAGLPQRTPIPQPPPAATSDPARRVPGRSGYAGF